MSGAVPALLLAVFPALAVAAALSDAATLTIPNRLCAVLALAFFPAAMAAGLPASVVGLSVVLAGAALAAGMALFALGWIGGGDAKLFAASVLWLGLAGAAPFLMWTAVAGGVLAGSLLAGRRLVADRDLPLWPPGWARRLLEPRGDIPYGVAIAAGALAAFPNSGLVLALR